MEDRVSRERWDERYAAEEAVWNPDPNALLVAELEDLAPGRALDLACGRGRNSVWLAGKGWLVTGVDFSAEGLAKARRLAADRAVEVTWVEADVVTWQPRSASFELVLVTYLHVPGEERSQVLARAQSALAPGGVLLGNWPRQLEPVARVRWTAGSGGVVGSRGGGRPARRTSDREGGACHPHRAHRDGRGDGHRRLCSSC